jgi:hypothetical protein
MRVDMVVLDQAIEIRRWLQADVCRADYSSKYEELTLNQRLATRPFTPVDLRFDAVEVR